MSSNIATIRSELTRLFPMRKRNKRPTMNQLRETYDSIKARGYGVAHDGRLVAPFLRATPRLPDGTHGRWEKGKIVPRR